MGSTSSLLRGDVLSSRGTGCSSPPDHCCCSPRVLPASMDLVPKPFLAFPFAIAMITLQVKT